jgi:hypothetical protein
MLALTAVDGVLVHSSFCRGQEQAHRDRCQDVRYCSSTLCYTEEYLGQKEDETGMSLIYTKKKENPHRKNFVPV